MKTIEKLKAITNSVFGLTKRYDLSGEELFEIRKKMETDPYDAIALAYYTGYVRGHQATVSGAYRERKHNQESILHL